MITVPLATVASQTLTINLNNQSCQLAVYTLGLDADAHLYLDLSVAGVPILNTKICRNVARLLLGAGYRGFVGDLMFIDTQGDTDPVASGLGSRYELVYLLPSELPA